ncbi:hypothetical protein JQX13_32405 [Archangium violaceum]|uniref:hypothetical protein n=1 Tax=Archangium violaceum TaxID=83451 RepID=UPI00193B158E|nr:hypothetical protein [Archangium violaceum]QRK04902.1 hypothetical protein JQX13_32405 [Archangium violaceum]
MYFRRTGLESGPCDEVDPPQAKGFTGGGRIVSLLGRPAHFGTLRELSMVRKSLN